MTKEQKTEKIDISKDEQIGFHKGALSTLAKEREEMAKIITIVDQLMQMHIKALKDLGVDLEAKAKELASKAKGDKSTASQKGKLDELI
ncbi:hypothetical protein HZA96_03420 [Candidatus Woesearchaeota archaeon]|nr:hypothetical protein [Candidatus Woesearchaeota archaeon]